MEKDFTNIDKKFVDRAWENMLEQLDEAMPAPEKKRRIGFWWLFLGLLAGISLGALGTYHWLQDDEMPIAKEVLIENKNTEKTTEINTEELPAFQANLEEKAENKSDNPATDLENKASIRNSTKSLNETNTINTPSLKSTKKGTNQTPEKTPTLNKTPILENLIIADNNGEELEKEKEIIATSDVIAKDEETDQITAERVLVDHSLLNYSKLNKLDLTDEKEFKVALVDNSVVKKQIVGIESGAIFNTEWSGWYLGGFVEEEINNRFSWQFGINYSQQTFSQAPPIIIHETAALPGNDPNAFYFDDGSNIVSLDEIISGASIPEQSRSVTVVPLDLKLEYLNIPISVNYKITPNLSVNSGLIFSTLLMAPTNLTEGGLLNSGGLNTDDNIDLFAGNTQLAGDSEVTLLKLRKFDFATSLGLGFQVNKNLNIQTAYHFGITNFMKETSVKNYNRFFKLGLQYQFGR